jgi:hypothetical protein
MKFRPVILLFAIIFGSFFTKNTSVSACTASGDGGGGADTQAICTKPQYNAENGIALPNGKFGPIPKFTPNQQKIANQNPNYGTSPVNYYYEILQKEKDQQRAQEVAARDLQLTEQKARDDKANKQAKLKAEEKRADQYLIDLHAKNEADNQHEQDKINDYNRNERLKYEARQREDQANSDRLQAQWAAEAREKRRLKAERKQKEQAKQQELDAQIRIAQINAETERQKVAANLEAQRLVANIQPAQQPVVYTPVQNQVPASGNFPIAMQPQTFGLPYYVKLIGTPVTPISIADISTLANVFTQLEGKPQPTNCQANPASYVTYKYGGVFALCAAPDNFHAPGSTYKVQ